MRFAACPGDAEGLCRVIDQLGLFPAAFFELGEVLSLVVVGMEKAIERAS